MVFKRLFLFLLFISGCSSSLLAQKHPIPDIHDMITSGLNHLINQNYKYAEYYFSSLDRKYPKNPLGKIFLAANELALASELAQPFNSQKIERLLSQASETAERLYRSNENNLWYNYYMALVDGYKAYFNSVQKNWYSTLSDGLSAKKYYEKCLEIDSNFYDSYVAIGTWKFWSSDKTEFLHWLPFVSDSRDEGVKMLRTAAAASCYHSYFAAHGLFWIYINQKKFQDAQNLIEPLLKAYPTSRFIIWDATRAFEELDKKRAIEYFLFLLNSYKNEKLQTRCNIITLNYCLAKNYFALGEIELAAKFIGQVPDESKLTEYEKENLGARIERIKALRNNISKKNSHK